jgi:MFS family permease
MSSGQRAAVSPFRQPRGVWAVAFACVVSFMGIGLVDPIRPALSQQLKASPSTVELLFTSYLVVTAVAMLVTGWVSSRIGGKRTLVAGLVLIVAFSAAAGASHSIAEIIDFRAGWGLGNALFIATSLAVIIGAAGYVFTCWGILVAIFAVFAAPGSSAFVGLNNTLTTQAVMLVSPVERPVASAAYGRRRPASSR